MCLCNNHLGNQLMAYLRFMAHTLQLSKPDLASPPGVLPKDDSRLLYVVPRDRYRCTEKYVS